MNRPYFGFGIEQGGDLSSEHRRCEQSFLAVRQGNARPVLSNAVGVFGEIGRRVANRQRVHPNQARSLGVRVRIFDAELCEVSAGQGGEIGGWTTWLGGQGVLLNGSLPGSSRPNPNRKVVGMAPEEVIVPE